jgi:hypothetical protein
MATKRTSATAVVVSATDGNVRVFSGGVLVLKMDPEVSPEFPLWEQDDGALFPLPEGKQGQPG